ncbi:MAG: Glu/Leu/Phe/Val dehydrogenase dimerization domain-containing protein, partial [Bacteroidota bacterium]
MIDTQPEVKTKSVFDKMHNMQHEQLVFCRDEHTGLKAIIAIHNTVLGPSMGGTRMWNYATDEEAIEDVLRLSRGMTFKSALAGLNIGGGKAVIIGDARSQKNEVLMRRFGKFVNSLNGKYYTAEDMNITMRDALAARARRAVRVVRDAALAWRRELGPRFGGAAAARARRGAGDDAGRPGGPQR